LFIVADKYLFCGQGANCVVGMYAKKRRFLGSKKTIFTFAPTTDIFALLKKIFHTYEKLFSHL